MAKFQKSFYLVLIVLFYTAETGLRPVSTQSTTDTKPNNDTTVGNGLKPFRSTTKSRIAFLVGINSYKATTTLKYAVGDSNAIEDLLLKTGKYDKLIKLTDDGKITTVYDKNSESYISKNDSKIKPTKANIESTYKEVLAENPDMLLFYYSGHGFIEGEGGENFIAPKDVDVKFEKKKVGKETKTVAVPLNGISLKKMGTDAMKIKKIVFLIDACRSPLPTDDEPETAPAKDAGKKELTTKDTKSTKVDSAKEAKSAKSAKDVASKEAKIAEDKEIIRKSIFLKSEVLPRRVLEAEGITMLIGAAPEVSSLEDEDFKSGIFTHFLKKAFNGGVQDENQEEYITEENLSRYIEDRFKHYYELRKKESELAAEPKLYNLTFDRGKKGEILITYHRPIEGHERIDKPVYVDESRDREVNGKLVYNEKGKREELRFFAKDKQRDQFYPDSLGGVHKMKYAFENDTKGELKKFEAKQFNLENQEVFQFGTTLLPDKGWEYRGLYDTVGRDGSRPVPTDTNKIRYERQIFDFNGNNILQEYFDKDGKLLEIDGVATVVRAWDFNGEKTLEETYDKDKKLVDKDGFARYTASYKSKGNPISESWYGKDGKRVNNKNGFSRTDFVYDESAKLTEKLFYDKDSKLSGDKWGVATYTYSYNPACLKFYEDQLFEKDEFGDEDPDKEKSRVEWKLGKYKLCLTEEIHTDKEGKPAGDEKKIYKKVRTFNEKGFLVSEENFRPDNNRRHLENGVAKVVYSHDEDGNIISRKNFGEDEEATTKVSDVNGVHEYRYTYQEYFSYDGKPVLNECMYHRKDKGIFIELYGCALKIEHFGINGKSIEDKRKVYRTNVYYSGAYQEEANRHYYSLDNRNLWFEKRADSKNPFGETTLLAYYETKEGKEVLDRKLEFKYDERNKKAFEVYYETKEGKEVLVWKNEYKYDERNNKTLSAYYETKESKEVLVRKYEYKYDERNNKILESKYEIKEGRDLHVEKEEYKYDERNNKTLEAYYETKEGKEVLIRKYEYKYDEKNNKVLDSMHTVKDGEKVNGRRLEYKYDVKNNLIRKIEIEQRPTIENGEIIVGKEYARSIEYKYDERNNKTLEANYETKEGKEVLVSKYEYKYDERNNNTLEANYETKEGKEVLVSKYEYKYDERNNRTLSAYYETKEGKEVLVSKYEYKYDERSNNTLSANYETKEGKEVLVWKNEYKYDERNKRTLEADYETKEGKEVLVKKNEYKYDERSNRTLEAYYETKEGKEVLVSKYEYKYDERNNRTLEANYETKEGKEVLIRKYEYKYDERNNKTLETKYATKEGKLVLYEKSEYKYDERNNKTFFAKYIGEEETIQEKFTVDYRLESYASAVTQYEPQINQIEYKLFQYKDKDESEKKSLNQKLEDLRKEFEAKKKKYTLTEEKFGPNEKLESASYKLLFFNPRGPAEKRLMRVDLDRFYRPVKVGFEEE